MTKLEYVKHSFKLSEFDIKSIITAVKDNESINIRLTKEMFTDGNTELPLTKTELKKVKNNTDFLYILSNAKRKFIKLE